MPDFQFDHRTSNPGLHRLYVGYALETLRAVQDCIETLSSHSRVHSSIFTEGLIEQRRKFCAEDAAYFEAASLLYSQADLKPWTTPPDDPWSAQAQMEETPPLPPRKVGKHPALGMPYGGAQTARVAGSPLPEDMSHGGMQARRKAGAGAAPPSALAAAVANMDTLRERAPGIADVRDSIAAHDASRETQETPEAKRRAAARPIQPEPAPKVRRGKTPLEIATAAVDPEHKIVTRSPRKKIGRTSLITGKERATRKASTGKADT